MFLYNDDCFNIFPQLPDNSVDLVLCDTPYGVTANKWDKVLDLEILWPELWRVSKPNAPAVLFAMPPFDKRLALSQIKYYKYEWVWVKNNVTGFLNANKQPLRCCEYILVFYKKQCLYFPQLDIKDKPERSNTGNSSSNYGKTKREPKIYTHSYPRQLLNFDMVRPNKTIYSTEKPVPLLEYLIETYTREGAVVLDFCMGSGSTGEACFNLNRNFIGIEKDSEIFAKAENRLMNLYTKLDSEACLR